MTEWISLKDRKPAGCKYGIECLVKNTKRPGYIWRATYEPNDDVFVMRWDDCKERPLLDITHFIEIPYD